MKNNNINFNNIYEVIQLKSLSTLLKENNVTSTQQLENISVYLEEQQLYHIDYVTCFDVIEESCSEYGNYLLNGFSKLYDNLHELANVNSIPYFIDKLDLYIDDTSDLYNYLYDSLVTYYEAIYNDILNIRKVAII